jgi:4-amino-4-deoxy-L-arabinose transferase-like glycosyltransferase
LAFRTPVILILVVALLLSRGITKGEPFYNNDETRHVMNGVFMRDLLVDRPVAHPLNYAYEYYAKYPAIAVPHWPPLFYLIEGLFFLVFGISVWASRLAILGFALLGAYFWYRIAERYGSSSRALLSALIFCLLPTVMVFESVTMLEIPQVALCLGTIFFWLRWVERERAADVWAMALFAAAAMLISQKSVFLVVLLGLDLLLNRRFRLLRNWHAGAALIASLAAVLPWYLFSFRTLTTSYRRAIGDNFQHVAHLWTVLFYPRTLPGQLGIVLLILACIGIGWVAFHWQSQYRFLLLWVFSAYLSFTLIREKDARHIIIWLPPLVYFALLGIEAVWPWRRWLWVAYGTLAVYFLVVGIRFQRPRLTGVEDAARFVMAQSSADIVYYQGRLNGDFIFYVRQLDPQKRHMVARDKQVVVTNMVYARQPLLLASEQILDFFQSWGIRYIIIENKDADPGLGVVRELLETDRFERAATFPIQTNGAYGEPDGITVYRFRGEPRRSSQIVSIPMMTIRGNIPADLSRLAGRPWPN